MAFWGFYLDNLARNSQSTGGDSTMAQMPPSTPGQPAPAAPSSAGPNKKTYTILPYALTRVGGLIFLFVGKDDPDVKWNSPNPLIIFGGPAILDIILGFIPGLNVT